MPKSNLSFKKRPKNKEKITSKHNSKNIVFLDYGAGALPNPSSIHKLGVEVKEKLKNARVKVALELSVLKDEVIFTSGGTESNNLAIQGLVNYFLYSGINTNKKIPHIITTNIEHPSVLEVYKGLEKRELVEITIVAVENTGIIDPKKIKKEIRENTILISVMYANNEIGTIEPIKEIVKEVRHYKKVNNIPKNNYPFVHTDAIQAVNYLDLNIEQLGVDMLSLSGNKIYGGGKIGILCKKRYVNILPIFFGGDQEFNLRSGTENISEILRFVDAFVLVSKEKKKEAKRLLALRNYFINKLQKKYKEIIINGDLENRLPNNVNITFPKIPSDLLVVELSAKGIMLSSKSACKSSKSEGSYVIEAINKNIEKEIGGVRFTLGRNTKKSDLDYTIKSLETILLKLKKWYN